MTYPEAHSLVKLSPEPACQLPDPLFPTCKMRVTGTIPHCAHPAQSSCGQATPEKAAGDQNRPDALYKWP